MHVTKQYPSGVYAIRHKASGKLYVGSAIRLTRRLTGHRRQLNTRTALLAAAARRKGKEATNAST